MVADVLITVNNYLVRDDEKDVIKYQTKGQLYKKREAIFLKYEEKSEGLEGVKTTLKLEADRVTLIRHGKVSMNQVFKKDYKFQGKYDTPYGSFSLTTDTVGLEMVIGFDEGLVKICYDLYLADDFNSTNTLEISYEKIYANNGGVKG